MTEKLRDCFDEMVVYKDLKKSNLFGSCKFVSHILIVIKIDGIRAEICKPRKTNFPWNFRLHSVIRRTIAKLDYAQFLWILASKQEK